MTDTDAYIQRLLDADPIREPALRAIIETLKLPRGSHGLDVGCGIGLQAIQLAGAVGPEGHVTGLDILPELLTYGRDRAAQLGLASQITFREGDMYQLPFPDNSFDWAWSADCIGYPAGELAPLLAELMRVIRPGGSLNILAWTSQQVLPGHPLLEARLNADCSAYLPYLQAADPETHFSRGLRWFIEAGLQEVRAQTFVGEVQAPLGEGERTALISLFEMLWAGPSSTEPRGDWAEFQSLCTPGSPQFILDLPGYHAFFTYTIFRGITKKSRGDSKYHTVV